MKKGIEKIDKPKNVFGTIARIFSYMSNCRLQLFVTILCIILASSLKTAGTAFFQVIIDNYIVPLSGNYTAELFSKFVNTLFLIFFIYVIGALSNYIYLRLMVNIESKTLYKIRVDLFKKMEKLPLKYFDKHPHGELMSLYTNDIDTMREMFSNSFPSFIFSSISIISIFSMMLYYSWELSIIIFITFAIMIYYAKKIGIVSSGYFKEQQDELSKVNGYIEEIINGQKIVKVFCHENDAKIDFKKLNNTLCEVSTKANVYANVLMPILINLSDIAYTIISAIGALLIIGGALSLGTVIAFLQYTRAFVHPVTEISQQFTNVLTALAGAERVFNVIDEKAEEDNGYINFTNKGWKDKDIILSKFRGDVEFKDVVFGYDDDKIILKQISLLARSGQKIAFVGSTGAGKTTITNLINRFYDIQGGEISLDGIDVKNIKKDDLRKLISMVLQDIHLFTGTIMDNIRYGRLDASDEDVIKAAKLANADYFIQNLKDGYNTMLTADAANLSQGERQLLAIARAIVADRPILILDEATSSIDTRTEKLIESGLNSLMEGRTVFIIAHRLSTVRNADRIIVLEHGKIIESGTHEELLDIKGRYYRLYNSMSELD